jgi:predicted anti-sigma-YlaC factor YlaD
MNCEETKRFLDAYLDRELDLCRYSELEEHLSLCPSCQSLAQELEEFRALLMAGAQTLKAPPQLRANVLAAVRREQAKHSFAFLRQPWVYAAAVVVLSLFLALNILLPDARGELSRHAVLRPCVCR